MAKKRTNKQTSRKLPSTIKAREENRSYAAYAEENFAPTAMGSKSLLRSVSQRFPNQTSITSRSLLRALVQERQSVYAALIGRVMTGWSITVAAIACGLSRETVKAWMTQGLSDLAIDKDTYYSRFASDMHAALANCVGECEVKIASRNPLEYLRTGPGRAFYQGREEYWQEVNPQAPLPESELEPLAEIGQGQGIANASLPDDRRAQAVEELRKLGILQNPQFVEQLSNNLNTVAAPTSNKGQIIDSIPPAQLNTKCTDVPGTQ